MSDTSPEALRALCEVLERTTTQVAEPVLVPDRHGYITSLAPTYRKEPCPQAQQAAAAIEALQAERDFLQAKCDSWEAEAAERDTLVEIANAERDRLAGQVAALREACEQARLFIASEHTDPAAAPSGEWLSREARPSHDMLCTVLADTATEPDTGCEDDQIWADVPVEALRRAVDGEPSDG